MNQPTFSCRARQRGIAAVELALLLVVMTTLLFAPCMIAVSLFQSTVAQRAVHNAAHMVAMYPPFQRVAPGADPTGEAVTMVANALIGAGVVAAGSAIADQVEATCPQPVSVKCRTNVVPEQIRVAMFIEIVDPLSTFRDDQNSVLQITVYSNDRYAN